MLWTMTRRTVRIVAVELVEERDSERPSPLDVDPEPIEEPSRVGLLPRPLAKALPPNVIPFLRKCGGQR